MRWRESFSGRMWPDRCVSASSRNRALFASSASRETLELDHLLHAPAALDESRPDREKDSECAEDETDDESSDGH
jgi:hypothetical protein